MMGKRAIVIGAGIAGLTSARAVADHFEHVLILERDRVPSSAVNRAGIPQGKHIHVVLGGGQHALETLFPGFVDALATAGAAPVRVASELRVERPGYDPLPQRDFGWDGYWMSRPLVEHVVRTHVRATPNIERRDGCRVLDVIADDTSSSVRAVRWTASNGSEERSDADLVIDASGDGRVTLDHLRAAGQTAPRKRRSGSTYRTRRRSSTFRTTHPRSGKASIAFPSSPRAGVRDCWRRSREGAGC